MGTLMIGILMLIICADIVARNAMGASLPLVSELGALLLVMIVALQLATTIRAGRMARTELVSIPLEQRSPRLAALLQAVFQVCGAGLLGAIAWASVRVLMKDYDSDEFIGTPGLGTLPTWPFRALILIGFAFAAVECALAAMRGLFVAAGGAR
ncbi:MAG: TRAP transporter small permease [Pseudooceanicola sp.]|nr:TRAP transporter small permease [Pseudooceanicola sp.]